MESRADKVSLKIHKLSDAKRLSELLNEKTVSVYMATMPYPYRKKDAESFIKDARDKRKKKIAYNFAIVVDGEIVGGIGIQQLDYINQLAEVGYWVGKSYRRRGYGSQAVNLVLSFAFTKIKLHKVYARVYGPNVGSGKLLKKLGFKMEGNLRKQIMVRKRWYDVMMYGLLKDEFRKLQK